MSLYGRFYKDINFIPIIYHFNPRCKWKWYEAKKTILSLNITNDKRRSNFFQYVLFNDEASFHNNGQLNPTPSGYSKSNKTVFRRNFLCRIRIWPQNFSITSRILRFSNLKVQKTHFLNIFEVMLHYEINFFPKTRYGIWKYYSFPSKSIFNRSNIFFLFREIVKLIDLTYSSIYIAKLINLTISRKRKKIFERLKMDFEGKE